MKKNWSLRIAGLMAVLVLITCTFVGGTFAKYTSSATGTDVATVAKWDVTVNGTQIAVSPAATVDFDLFETIMDSDGTTAETDVKASLIAPGTSGKFDLAVQNKSEVNATYAIELNSTNASNIPVEYSVDGGINWLDEAAFNAAATGNLAMGMTAAETITVQWRWAYEEGADATAIAANDAIDTALGILAQTEAPTLTVEATITVTQVD